MEYKQTPLSVYFIVKNEEVRLPEALAQAVKVADELIVVDSGSTDRTMRLLNLLVPRLFIVIGADLLPRRHMLRACVSMSGYLI